MSSSQDTGSKFAKFFSAKEKFLTDAAKVKVKDGLIIGIERTDGAMEPLAIMEQELVRH
jgi:hypothetical protein